jgi:hypothetical protein
MHFPIVATVLSMVLGLSVTRLLLGLVTVFRIRRSSPVDWVPLLWAGVLFLIQLEFWWAINQLPALRPTFSFPEFVFLVLLTMMLFLSAALVLPSRSEDEQLGLRRYYELDGCYALLSLSAFLTLGFLANTTFFAQPVLSVATAVDVPMIVLPIFAFFAKRRATYRVIALLYVPLAVFDTFIALAS